MRRMLLRVTGPVATRRLVEDDGELPQTAAGQVALRVLACGVCRTDIHIVEGEVPAPLPVVPDALVRLKRGEIEGAAVLVP